MKFKNPVNGYEEELSMPGLWVFCFGFFYFAVKGVWTHAIASFILAVCTFGLSWFIYPFFAGGIMRKYYLRQGWSEV